MERVLRPIRKESYGKWLAVGRSAPGDATLLLGGVDAGVTSALISHWVLGKPIVATGGDVSEPLSLGLALDPDAISFSRGC
jgi:hypothetical protein